MILNSKPENEAILSNVGEIGEFRIRNSAKAFNILSSGLYANKIRAVVRELSCNAVDSHAAAGSADVPFEVHMPSMLEPWFSVRDYGVGLNHDQVTRIYTTYFESTKTDSNEFIGALGLGSKSPFSYTDNFTVTAIQHGRQGIYTAFINADGVPSIALMQSGETDQPTGVEVKFSVNDRNDFSKFRTEATNVYRWFAVKPTVLGVSGFQHEVQVYEVENLVPGVHTVPPARLGMNITSYAVMGNIAYPVDVPNAVENLGDLSFLLQCGLVMHFGIGDLDFQASREGLSYIPQTIDSIRTKLLAVRSVLTGRLTVDAEAIGNLWQRAQWLNSQFEKPLWKAAVTEYVRNTGFRLFDPGKRYDRFRIFELREDQLKERYNIEIHMFNKSNYGTCRPQTPDRGVEDIKVDPPVNYTFWSVPVARQTLFVISDVKTGALTRTKYHWRHRYTSGDVYVLTSADKTQPMKTSEFMAAIGGPPDEQIHLASELDQPERQARGSNAGVTIMALTLRNDSSRFGRRSDKAMVWRATYSLDQFNTTNQVLYVPLVGFEVQSQHGVTDIKVLHTELLASGLFGDKLVIHGVRKQDLAQVQALPNWVNLEDHIVRQLSNMDDATIQGMALNQVDSIKEIMYNKYVLPFIADDKNLLKLLIQKLTPVKAKQYSRSKMESLSQQFAPSLAVKVNDQIRQLTSEVAAVNQRYPLLKHLGDANSKHVAEYINLIENQN